MAGFYARPPSGANRHVHMTSADPVLSRNGSCVVRHSKCGAPNNRGYFFQKFGVLDRSAACTLSPMAVGIFAPQRTGGSARTQPSGCGRRARSATSSETIWSGRKRSLRSQNVPKPYCPIQSHSWVRAFSGEHINLHQGSSKHLKNHGGRPTE